MEQQQAADLLCNQTSEFKDVWQRVMDTERILDIQRDREAFEQSEGKADRMPFIRSQLDLSEDVRKADNTHLGDHRYNVGVIRSCVGECVRKGWDDLIRTVTAHWLFKIELMLTSINTHGLAHDGPIMGLLMVAVTRVQWIISCEPPILKAAFPQLQVLHGALETLKSRPWDLDARTAINDAHGRISNWLGPVMKDPAPGHPELPGFADDAKPAAVSFLDFVKSKVAQTEAARVADSWGKALRRSGKFPTPLHHGRPAEKGVPAVAALFDRKILEELWIARSGDKSTDSGDN